MEGGKKVNFIYVMSSPKNSEGNAAPSMLQNNNTNLEDRVMLLCDNGKLILDRSYSNNGSFFLLPNSGNQKQEVSFHSSVSNINVQNPEQGSKKNILYPRKCSVCLRFYATKESFCSHKKTCKPPDQASTCLNTFTAEFSAYTQKERKTYPRKCLDCLKTYKSKSSFFNHRPSCRQRLLLSSTSAPKPSIDEDGNASVPSDCQNTEVSAQAEDQTSIADDVGVNDLTCWYCRKQYLSKSIRDMHSRVYHKIITSFSNQDATSDMECENSVECSNANDPSNQDATSDMQCENSEACSNVNIPKDCEIVEVCYSAEKGTSLISGDVRDNDLICKYCLKQYSCKGHRDSHIRVAHFREDDLICKYCLKQYSCKSHRDRHVRVHHLINISSSDQGDATDMQCGYSEADCIRNVPKVNAQIQTPLIPEGAKVEDLMCKYCQGYYSCKRLRDKHIRVYHKIKQSLLNKNDAPKMPGENSEACGNANDPSASSFDQDVTSDVQHENSEEASDDIIGSNDCENMEVGAQSVISEGAEVDKLTCEFCLKKYPCKRYKTRHMRVYHRIYKAIGRHLKCIECDITFTQMEKLREHLQMTHNLNMEPEEVHLPNMNAFYKWKQEVERRDVASFRIKKKDLISDQERKYFFICQQSGKLESKISGPRKRMLKVSGAYKMGKSLCTAVIFCDERADGVYVKYYPHHYGHGGKVPVVKPSIEEPDAIEDETNDVPFENLLDDIHESKFQDYHKMNLTKKKDFKFIKKAFSFDDYTSGLSDGESVERWVRLCCQMEDSPVLYYRKEEEEFTLMIMTEFQKHILLSSDKQLVSVNSLFRKICKGVYSHVTSIYVMDECEVAFPVAFCISNKLDKNVIKQFLLCIRESTGPLSCTYLASDWKKYIYEAWVETMGDEPKWLWSLWSLDNRHIEQLRNTFTKKNSSETLQGVYVKRAEAYNKFRTMLECQNPNTLETMFTNYVKWLLEHPQTEKLGKSILEKLGPNKHIWANCYQKDLKLSTLISMELLNRTIRYCSTEGRIKQRLDKFLFVIMKLVRYKMLARLTNILDNEKMDLAIDAINKCHQIGLDISTDRISSISDKIWLIRADAEEEDMYITCEFDKCPELCSLRCSECDICVHMYSCSCMQNMINANLCPHVHAIVFKFLRPHFSPMNSPAHEDTDDLENFDFTPNISPSELLLESALKKTHDVYKNICSNKCNLNQESLTAVVQRLNDCIDICSGKKVTDNKSTNTEPLSPVKESKSTADEPITINTASQPFMLPKNLQTMLTQNQPLSRYFVVLPNNTNDENATYVQM